MEKDKYTFSDQELIEKWNEWVSELNRLSRNEWVLSVPVQLNKDPDVLFSELAVRFKDTITKIVQKPNIPLITNPMGRSWKQPSLSRLSFVEGYVIMDAATFNELHNYELTYPSGVYEGKMWRSGGLLMWYDNHDTDPNLCSVKSIPIAIKQPKTSRSFPKPPKKSIWIRLAEKLRKKQPSQK